MKILNKFSPVEGAKRFSRKLIKSDEHGRSMIEMLGVLAIIGVLSLGVAGNALACSEGAIACGDDCAADDGKSTCSWEISSTGELKISGKGEMGNYDTPNPSTPWYSNKDSITSINISNGITGIGANAFLDLDHVTGTLTVPNSVTSIDYAAFKNMSGVSKLELPDSLTTLGSWVFEGMTGLSGQLVIPETVTSMKGNFLHNDTVTSLVLPDAVDIQYDKAFQYMGSLSVIVIPDSLDASDWASNVFGSMPSKVKIRCQGDVNTCKSNLSKFGTSITKKILAVNNETQCTGKYVWDSAASKCNRMNEEQCNSTEKYYYNNGVCENLPQTSTNCESANFTWNSTSNKCFKKVVETADSCNAKGQVLWEEACYDEYPFAKKHYTPAEANQWLIDDNNNTITIIFKK